MGTRVLSFRSFGDIPFSEKVREIIDRELSPLVAGGVLEVDYEGKRFGGAPYTIEFEARQRWIEGATRFRCHYRPFAFGESGVVWVDAHVKINSCSDVERCKTCEPRYRRSPDELGGALAYTALHELGHQFGLVDRASYTGADEDGHTGDPTNPMFSTNLHKDWRPLAESSRYSKKHTIVEGESLSAIAQRFALGTLAQGGKLLYDFVGQDGRRNSELLRSGNPDLIYPREEIWIPDPLERNKFLREIDVREKHFTKTQIQYMSRWVAAGRSILEVK